MFELILLPVALSVAALILAVLVGVLLIRFGPKDAPNGGHKDHAVGMPTSGGIAVFATVIPLTILLFFLKSDWFSFPIFALLGGAVYMFIMGVWDDIVALPALPKLLAQLVIAGAVAYFGVRVSFFDLARNSWETGVIVGTLGSAAWMVVVTNAVNFMDGSDGLAVGSSAVIAAALTFLAAVTGVYDVMAFALILLGGLLGLLFWNGRGKLFSGDAGALFIGLYLAGLTLIWIERTHVSVWIAPALFVAFLSDVLLTLVWRYQHGRKLMQPHKEHIYQIILKAGISQPLTAWIYAWISVHGALVAGISLIFPMGGALVGFAILILIMYILNRKIRASAINHGHLVP